jgi:hypothetical protein
MLLSALRTPRGESEGPAPFRPALESLDDRIVPASPHFISATSGINAAGALVVNFKEAGLGDNQNIDYALTGDVSATFGYVNKGGNVVQGEPWGATDVVLATGTFSSGKNGQVTATLTSDAPALNLKQPSGKGWNLVYDISYTNLVLTDTTSGAFIAVPDASVDTFPA